MTTASDFMTNLYRRPDIWHIYISRIQVKDFRKHKGDVLYGLTQAEAVKLIKSGKTMYRFIDDEPPKIKADGRASV